MNTTCVLSELFSGPFPLSSGEGAVKSSNSSGDTVSFSELLFSLNVDGVEITEQLGDFKSVEKLLVQEMEEALSWGSGENRLQEFGSTTRKGSDTEETRAGKDLPEIAGATACCSQFPALAIQTSTLVEPAETILTAENEVSGDGNIILRPGLSGGASEAVPEGPPGVEQVVLPESQAAPAIDSQPVGLTYEGQAVMPVEKGPDVRQEVVPESQAAPITSSQPDASIVQREIDAESGVTVYDDHSVDLSVSSRQAEPGVADSEIPRMKPLGEEHVAISVKGTDDAGRQTAEQTAMKDGITTKVAVTGQQTEITANLEQAAASAKEEIIVQVDVANEKSGEPRETKPYPFNAREQSATTLSVSETVVNSTASERNSQVPEAKVYFPISGTAESSESSQRVAASDEKVAPQASPSLKDQVPAVISQLFKTADMPVQSGNSGTVTPGDLSETAKGIVSQIISKAQLIFKGSGAEMKIRLKPPALGDLTIRVILEEGLLTAKMNASSQTVKGMLESSLPQLKQGLEDRGVRVDRFIFEVGGEHASDNFEERFSPRPKDYSSSDKGAYLRNDDEERGKLGNRFSRLSGSIGRLDIVI